MQRVVQRVIQTKRGRFIVAPAVLLAEFARRIIGQPPVRLIFQPRDLGFNLRAA